MVGVNFEQSVQISKRINAQSSMCWENAYRALRYLPEATYVEGWVVKHGHDVMRSKNAIEHGWLEFEGQIIDPTFVLTIEPAELASVAYFAGVRYSKAEAAKFKRKRKGAMPLVWANGWGGEDCPEYMAAHQQAWALVGKHYEPGPHPTGLTAGRTERQQTTGHHNERERLSRNTRDFLELLDYCDQRACGVVSIAESLDTSTDVGCAVVSVLMVFAELERKQIATRIRTGKTQKAWGGGYNGIKKPLVPQPRNRIHVIYLDVLQVIGHRNLLTCGCIYESTPRTTGANPAPVHCITTSIGVSS